MSHSAEDPTLARLYSQGLRLAAHVGHDAPFTLALIVLLQAIGVAIAEAASVVAIPAIPGSVGLLLLGFGGTVFATVAPMNLQSGNARAALSQVASGITTKWPRLANQ